ncbi:MAG: hypothetical protein AVDCRST_MAG19-447, partial [uncultured Thermomicrobiales bacterium]
CLMPPFASLRLVRPPWPSLRCWPSPSPYPSPRTAKRGPTSCRSSSGTSRASQPTPPVLVSR